MALAAHKEAFHVNGDGGERVACGKELRLGPARAEPADAAGYADFPGSPSAGDGGLSGPAACAPV